jgi:hypothetical protein
MCQRLVTDAPPHIQQAVLINELRSFQYAVMRKWRKPQGMQ